MRWSIAISMVAPGFLKRMHAYPIRINLHLCIGGSIWPLLEYLGAASWARAGPTWARRSKKSSVMLMVD